MASFVMNMVGGGGSGGFFPSIHVFGTTGATVTATKGTEVITLTEIASGEYWGEVTDYGEWVVSGGGISKTFTVDKVEQYVNKPLNDCTWAEISEVSERGEAANWWSVGDCKAVTLNGTCGTVALDTTLYVYILGFDHNSELEGTGITFGTFKTAASDGVDVMLVDSNYGNTSTDGTKYFSMSHWGAVNYGGWKGCDARYDILGSTKAAPSGYGSAPTTSRVGYDAPSDTATSPVSNTLMSCLPSVLRAVMKPMTKYTDNVGNTSNIQANVTSSIDYLPFLAEWEIFGARTDANQYEQNYQEQYSYYVSGNSKVKYKHNATTSAGRWWERSPGYNWSNRFCLVTNMGAAEDCGAYRSYGLAPIFKV